MRTDVVIEVLEIGPDIGDLEVGPEVGPEVEIGEVPEASPLGSEAPAEVTAGSSVAHRPGDGAGRGAGLGATAAGPRPAPAR